MPLAIAVLLVGMPGICFTSAMTVLMEQKISSTEGDLAGPLDDNDFFGNALCPIGDLDGDGVLDIVATAELDDDGGNNKGAVYVLFLNPDGTVKGQQKISATQGNFDGPLNSFNNNFGRSVTGLGDLDRDGFEDIAVGDDVLSDGGTDRGAVWLLFLHSDGTVLRHQKISSTDGGFNGSLSNGDNFGRAVEKVGDLDGDGVNDLAVGANHDSDGGTDRGAVWILFLKTDGTVKSHQKISSLQGGFTGSLADGDRFGSAITALRDLDGDGIQDLAVSAQLSDDGGSNRGSVWILFMNPDGTVKGHQKISQTEGGFSGDLEDDDSFGGSLAILPDVDGDGIRDLAVGASGDDDGGTDRGAIWVLFMSPAGTVNGHRKISSSEGALTGLLDDGDRLGWSLLGSLPPIGTTGSARLMVGSRLDDDGGVDRGAFYVLLIQGPVFTDGFELGNLSAWSSSQQP